MTEYIRHTLAFGGMPGGWEWIIILIVALLIFGKRLPELARSLGKSLTEFKKGIHEAKETKDELTSEVKKVKSDIVDQAKDAAGLNDFDKPD